MLRTIDDKTLTFLCQKWDFKVMLMSWKIEYIIRAPVLLNLLNSWWKKQQSNARQALHFIVFFQLVYKIQ